MEHRFPPIPLLKAHVEFVMQNAEEIRKTGTIIAKVYLAQLFVF